MRAWGSPLMVDEAKDEQQPEIRYLGDLQRMKPEPGDVFVLTLDGQASREAIASLRETLKAALGDATVLVLTGGMKLGCVAMPGNPPKTSATPWVDGERTENVTTRTGHGLFWR